MSISDNQNQFAQDSDLLSLKPLKNFKRKTKPHLPPDLLGKRYVKLFWHPFKAIFSELPDKQELPPQELALAKAQEQPSDNKPLSASKPKWRTIDYYLHPSQLWRWHQDEKQLVGIRFDTTTYFAIIDLDKGGKYHNPESINRIKSALEDIGIVSIVPIQSSWSGGYHLILVLEEKLPTFNLACALEQKLKSVGLIPKPGHLEIFPNVKSYSKTEITNYNAIRCPMQPGSGALLLDDDLQPISNNVAIFLAHCEHAARRQDLTKLKRFCQKARKRHKPKYDKQKTSKIDAWRSQWEAIITTGWTATGQTNTLLPIFVNYGIVFLELEGENLVKYAVNTATSAPGYSQYCQHQHEIEAKVRDWVECTIRHEYYTPYPSYPQRLLKTYSNTYAEVIAGTKNSHKPLNNIIPIDRRRQQSRERSQQAQQRISTAVKAIERETGLAAGVKARAQQIIAECKRQFNQSPSMETMQKNLNLWHPNWYIEDPWAENSSNPCQIESYGYLDKETSQQQKSRSQNPCQTEGYGYSPLMKVFEPFLLAPARRGWEPIVYSSCPTDFGTSETVQPLDIVSVSHPESVNSETANPDPEFVNPKTLNSLKISSSHNNQLNDLSAPLNIKLLNQNNSDQDFKYLFTPRTSLKLDKQNLLNSPISVQDADSKSLEEQWPDVSVGLKCEHGISTVDKKEIVTNELVELKERTKLHLQAVSEAKKAVKKYCFITRRLLSVGERTHLEQTVKMQFYLDSKCPVLVAKAEAWSRENPGCLPFSLLSAFENED